DRQVSREVGVRNSRISPRLVTKLIGAVMVAEFENCSSREIADAYRGGRVDRVIPRIVSEGGHQWIENRRGTSGKRSARARPAAKLIAWLLWRNVRSRGGRLSLAPNCVPSAPRS